MDQAFQIIDALFLRYIFGTRDRPRPMIVRIALRAVMFGGGLVMLAFTLGYLTTSFWSILYALCWIPLAVLMMGAEARLGNPRVSLIIFGMFVTLVVLVLFAR